MANCMLTPVIIAREVCLWLPSDAEVLAWEHGLDVMVEARTCGDVLYLQIPPNDRIRSLDEVRAIYKPKLDAALVALWRVA